MDIADFAHGIFRGFAEGGRYRWQISSDFAHGIFRGFAEGEISDYDSVEILDQKVIQNGTIGQIFYPKKNFIMEYF